MTDLIFYWHDYETFGVSPRRDRPAQFAGIRTDGDLNPIGEPLMMYCQPAPDYLPRSAVLPAHRHPAANLPRRRSARAHVRPHPLRLSWHSPAPSVSATTPSGSTMKSPATFSGATSSTPTPREWQKRLWPLGSAGCSALHLRPAPRRHRMAPPRGWPPLLQARAPHRC